MKRLLLLGAARHQIPAIIAARELGLVVFTADNLPSNPGHALADATFSVSAADPNAVAELAADLRVDGILGFASEICARTAAQVADKLDLPSAPLRAVETLSRKDLFRELLRNCELNLLTWRSFSQDEADEAAAWAANLPNGCVVKPVDNSGGRGVTIRPSAATFSHAFAAASSASWQRRVIVEEFVTRQGSQFGADGWMEDGRLAFIHFFDNDTLPPPADGAAICEIFPSAHPAGHLLAMRQLLERILQLAGYHRGPFNFDGCYLAGGRPFVFEIAPRNGGNFIPEMIRRQTGVDLTLAAVEAAVDPEFRLAIPASPRKQHFHGTWVLHAPRSGRFREVHLHADLQPCCPEVILYKSSGSEVRSFACAGDTLGVVLLEFPSPEVQRDIMDRLPELCTVCVDD